MDRTTAEAASVRVFISYAHGDAEHENQVRRLWLFLCDQGIDAQLDLAAAEEPRDWTEWTTNQIRTARFILMVASPEYRRLAEGGPREGARGRGVEWETNLIREEVYAERQEARKRFLPVVLLDDSTDGIPVWMGPTSHTHYRVQDFTVPGAERLLRLLTGQPYEVGPPLGAVPVLLRRTSHPPSTTDTTVTDVLLRRLAERSPDRNEAMVQADVRQLLTLGGLGLDADDLRAASSAGSDDRRRIDIPAGFAVVEVRKDLRTDGLLTAAERQLTGYVATRGERIDLVILTDGALWRLYRHADGADVIEYVTAFTVDPSATAIDALLMWLESALATGRSITPTPQQIVHKLGADSPSHALFAAELTAIYAAHRDQEHVQVKRDLWAKLLTTALGTNFTDDDELFVNHTLLVVTAEVIGHAVVGIRPDDPRFSAVEIMSGTLFRDAQIHGVIEADFFDWIAEVPGGDRFVKRLAQRLTRFAWEQVEHDVMKLLYESIISPQTRHRLGEYYTPDWLAEQIVAECVTDPLRQRVLDPSCGSGTFLFHAIRHYLAAADRSTMSKSDAIQGAVKNVIGLDVHPVAVTLARVTCLLAIGMSRLRTGDRPAFTVQVSLGDSLRWGVEPTLLSYAGLSIATDNDHRSFVSDPDVSGGPGTGRLRFPERVVADIEKFDRLVADLAKAATQREPGSAAPNLRAIFRRHEIDGDDQRDLTRTFDTMCALHDRGRDHIWSYYVRNIARSAWLTKPENQVEVLVGNPPWLAYRYMTDAQQASFRTMCTERGLWAGSGLATNQDLSALFVVRCIELYLRPGGRFGHVMPLAVLSRRQYAGFRTGSYRLRQARVEFYRPWDLHRIKPAFFPVPACVVLGRRVNGDGTMAALVLVPDVWSGKFDTPTASLTEAAANITRTVGETAMPLGPGSPYGPRFSQGATVVPRVLFVVEPDDTNPLGAGAGRRAVRSRRSVNEKRPWKDLPALRGIVERRFVRPLYTGDAILPFRCRQPLEAVIPWDGHRPLSDEDRDPYPGLTNWWRQAEDVWTPAPFQRSAEPHGTARLSPRIVSSIPRHQLSCGLHKEWLAHSRRHFI